VREAGDDELPKFHAAKTSAADKRSRKADNAWGKGGKDGGGKKTGKAEHHIKREWETKGGSTVGLKGQETTEKRGST